jgi:hypothetical protein
MYVVQTVHSTKLRKDGLKRQQEIYTSVSAIMKTVTQYSRNEVVSIQNEEYMNPNTSGISILNEWNTGRQAKELSS